MKYKCIITDDEPLAIEVIKSHLGNLPLFEVTGECSNAMEAFQLLKTGNIDLMFLDIQMPGMKGTDFLKNLLNPPKVILTTAYRDYAIEAFDLNVVDYLLKPISYERFLKAIDKFLSHLPGPAPEHAKDQYIYLNINKNIHKVKMDDIVYAESVKDYLTIHTVSGSLTVKHTISSFEQMLPHDRFLRIHRSYIVSLDKIRSFNAQIVDTGLKKLPIGQNHQAEVLEKLKYPLRP
jgi:two-component system, LytTR family, response regulator